MIGNILVGVAVLWASIFTSIKIYKFFKNFTGDEYFKCSCSSCPFMKNK
jgi:hypothetical protein